MAALSTRQDDPDTLGLVTGTGAMAEVMVVVLAVPEALAVALALVHPCRRKSLAWDAD